MSLSINHAKILTEAIWKYNKDKYKKIKRTPAAKIDLI